MIERLSFEDVRNIFIWLKEHELDFDAGRLHRDFSDGVNVAKILKSIYPRLVEMNNYPKCNSTNLKIQNWETLSYKVLSKIGLPLKRNRINKLAKAKSGAIEALLHQIMLKEMEYRRENDTTISLQEQIWTENDDVVTVNVKKSFAGDVTEGPEKLILYSIYDEANKKSQQLSTEMEALAQKIEHLENLQKLKLEHIQEVCERLARVSVDAFKNDVSKSDIPPLDLKEINESSSDSSTVTDTGDFHTC